MRQKKKVFFRGVLHVIGGRDTKSIKNWYTETVVLSYSGWCKELALLTLKMDD